jgi:hypothetical protein
VYSGPYLEAVAVQLGQVKSITKHDFHDLNVTNAFIITIHRKGSKNEKLPTLLEILFICTTYPLSLW